MPPGAGGHYALAVPFQVRLRPNAHYLGILAIGVVLIAFGALVESGFGAILAIAPGVLILAALGVPVVVSTIFRVPVLAVDPAGVRLPMMGVRLAWADVAAIQQGVAGPRATPILLIIPRDQQSAVSQMRPWVRSEGRSNIKKYGTPIIVPEKSTDRTLDEMLQAIASVNPATADS